MATAGEADCSLASKCMDFCQALASQGLPFHFSLNMGPDFTFSLDTRGKAGAVPVKKKKVSPSTQRRNARRREEFLLKKRQHLSTVDAPVEKATVPQFSCDQCDYTNVSEKGLRQHIRMKHRREQLENQLQKSSSPATPESLRFSTQATSLASSPPLHSSREETCPNSLGVNFMARCGQKSDLSGLCGIGYWVSGLVKCLPQSQWLLQSYKRSFDCKSNIKESSKSVAITII